MHERLQDKLVACFQAHCFSPVPELRRLIISRIFESHTIWTKVMEDKKKRENMTPFSHALRSTFPYSPHRNTTRRHETDQPQLVSTLAIIKLNKCTPRGYGSGATGTVSATADSSYVRIQPLAKHVKPRTNGFGSPVRYTLLGV